MKEKCCFKNEKVKRSGTSYQVLDSGGVTGQSLLLGIRQKCEHGA